MPLFDEIERARNKMERRLEPEVNDIFMGQGGEIIRVVESSHSVLWAQFEAERIAGDERFAREAIGLIYTTTFPSFAQAAYEALTPVKADRDTWVQKVLEFLGLEGGRMIRAIAQTTLEDVRKILIEGIKEGEGVAQIAKRLREEWPGLTRLRAERIVRTEVIAASNAGSTAGYERVSLDFGLDLQMEWLATSDPRTRQEHIAANGQRAPLGGTFTVGGETARYPGDPMLSADQRVNCRCTVVPVTATKSVGFLDRRDEEMRRAYPSLKAEHGAYQARLELADQHALSERQVRRILFTGERA